MQVLASGQAGLFAIQTPTGFLVERVDTGEALCAEARDLRYYFSGCNDLRFLSLRDDAEARGAAEIAWAADRAVRLFIMLLDPAETAEDLIEVGEALEELLADRCVQEAAEAQLFSTPMPEPVDAGSISTVLAEAPLGAALFNRFLELQMVIAQVRAAFDRVDDGLFDNKKQRAHFLEEAIDRGCLRALV
ncbi:MAG: hypothetical protein EON56_01380, partial [Alphaproteobacteria bacterium]